MIGDVLFEEQGHVVREISAGRGPVDGQPLAVGAVAVAVAHCRVCRHVHQYVSQ